MRSLELFAGAGGSLIGYHDEGFETAMAVEIDEDAAHTLRANNPEVKVFQGCVRNFLEELDSDTTIIALGRIDHIHFSSPCQDFSKANRHQSARRDRAELTLLLLDFIQKTKAVTAVFENVVGLFDRNNVAYLKKLSIGLLKMGYQMKCSVLKACDYGDAQIVSDVHSYTNAASTRSNLPTSLFLVLTFVEA